MAPAKRPGRFLAVMRCHLPPVGATGRLRWGWTSVGPRNGGGRSGEPRGSPPPCSPNYHGSALQGQRQRLGEGTLLDQHQQKEAARKKAREERARQARRAAIQVRGNLRHMGGSVPRQDPVCWELHSPPSLSLWTWDPPPRRAHCSQVSPDARNCSRSEPRSHSMLTLGGQRGPRRQGSPGPPRSRP